LCGIAGIINLYNCSPIAESVINRMAKSLVHRGPDDFGTYVDDRVALGHTRLMIIDLSSSGKQPLFDVSGRAGIVFNGEVYNYNEIKQELLGKGYRFKSSTDTEVVLNYYLEYGFDCLEKFIGMFAFAIYDKSKSQVFLARDRIGIKPLYYTLFDDKLIFASEIKAILLYPGFQTEPDVNAISSYLSYRYPIGENTLFKNIFSLQPGHYLDISASDIVKKQYWDLPINIDKEDFGEDYYLRNVKELLENSVRYRMISDVPLGAYLSGGLDSSIIVSIMSKFSDNPVKTFTIGFADEGYNEFEYAKQVANMCSTDHHEIMLGSDKYIENMIRLIKFKDSPLSVANEPALYVMSQKLKQYITVVLSGEGADEIFGGYGRIFRSPYDYLRLKELSENNQTNNKTVFKTLIKNLNSKYSGKSFHNEIDHFLELYSYISWNDKEKFLDQDIISILNGDHLLYQLFNSQFDRINNLNIYDKYMWIFEKFHIIGLLHRVDMTTMATSVEARVPFVDHRLVEFALAMPVRYKLKWKSLLDKIAASVCNSDQISEKYDIPKYILKKAFEKQLPPDVVWRRKMGFPVPIHNWLGSNFNDFAMEVLLDDKARSRKIYNFKNLENMLNNQELFKKHKFGLKIWMLVNLELWFQEYFD